MKNAHKKKNWFCRELKMKKVLLIAAIVVLGFAFLLLFNLGTHPPLKPVPMIAAVELPYMEPNSSTFFYEDEKSPFFSWRYTISGEFSHTEVAMGTTKGGTEIVDWTKVENYMSSYEFNPKIDTFKQSLEANRDYYISVRLIYDNKTASEVVSSKPFQAQYRITLKTFFDRELALFGEEFDLFQRSVVSFAGEKEKKDLLSEEFDKHIGGECFIDGFQDASANYENIGLILINEDAWENYDVWQRKWLLYHELGHCGLLIEEHPADNSSPITIKEKRPTYTLDGQTYDCPVSIMIGSGPSFIVGLCLQNSLEYYWEDLHVRSGR